MLGRRERLRHLTVERLELRLGDRVLDLGCGTGPNLELLTRAIGPQGSVLAIDASPEMLERAARLASTRGWRNVEVRLADAARAELAPESFAGVLCTLSLSAIPGHRAVSGSVREALEPRGAFAVLDTTLCPGWMRVLNPLIGPLFRRATN